MIFFMKNAFKQFVTVFLVICMSVVIPGCSARLGVGQENNPQEIAGSSSVEKIPEDRYQDNPEFTDGEFDEAKNQAELLLYLLLRSFSIESIIEGRKSIGHVELEPLEIKLFNFNTAFFDNPEFIYYQYFPKDMASMAYQFPIEKVKRLVYEVFGLEDWNLEGFDEGGIYLNEEKQQYESTLEFELGYGASVEDLTASVDKDTATIEFTCYLTDNIGFKGEPGWDEHGYYTIAFQMIRESNRVFIRFVGIDEIK